MGALFQQMVRCLELLQTELVAGRAERGAERRERLDDVALLADLATTGWRTVDRRLGRLEQKLERIEAALQPESAGTVIRMEDRQERRPGG